jgi:hypothetical protein
MSVVKVYEESEWGGVQRAGGGNPEVKAAVAEVKKLNWSERRHMRADARQIWQWDMASMINDVREEGRTEGLKEEREEAPRKMKK